MNLSRRMLNAAGLGTIAALAARPTLAFDGPIADAVESGDDFLLALDAYAFAYPLITMEMTRRVVTNVAKPEGTRAPMGQLIKLREYPSPTFRDVTAPNADTLYTTAFFDVGDEPWIVALPDMDDRYALFPMLDGWTTVFEVPGKRTTGTAAQTYAITGPGWTGTLPPGVVEYKSLTSIVWLLGRIYCTGTPEDYAAVHALQDKVRLAPLSAWNAEFWEAPAGKVDPAIDMKTPVRDQVNALGAVEYFTLFCELMKRNPPAPADGPMLEKLAALGIVPGQDFDCSKFDPAFEKRLPQAAYARIMLSFKTSDAIKHVNGWGYTVEAGIYGTDYVQRALVTAIGLGANRPEDAVYPTSLKQADGLLGRKYMGSEKYVMHFPKGQLPPAQGFWSLTMYDAQFFFVANPIDRYSISARQNLKTNPDGSVDLLIQHESPGAEKESNWLPAPEGQFLLMLRVYWPDESDPSLLNGTWTVPKVEKVG